MLKSILDKVITGLQMNSSSLVGFYSFGFSSGTSGVIYNEKLLNPVSDSFDDGKLLSSSYPIYNLCDDKEVTSVSGQASFDGETILQVGPNFPYTNWSIFIEYESEDFTGEYNIGRTLFSTMDSSISTSGINIGLNGANKPYVEYLNGNGQKNILTLNAELGKRNILSFSKSSDSETLEMSYYDPIYQNTKFEIFNTPSIEDENGVDKSYSDNMYIGDFYETGDANYRGFKGTVYDITIFNEFLGSGDRNVIQKAMVASDYSGERVERSLVLNTGITTIVSATSGVTGTGITGYQTVATGSQVQRCGPAISLFTASGLTGELSGLSYTTTTGSVVSSGFKFTRKEAEVYLDDSRILEFKRKNLILTYPIDSSDSTELFIYSGLETNINKRAEANTFENGFELTTGYTGQEFKFYKNGILRKSGILSNNEIVSGDYIVTGTNKVVFSDPLEEDGFAPDAFYDYITGQTTYVTYNPSIDYSYTTSPYVDSDVFFNGQKLLSGRSLVYHTDLDGTDLEIDETYLPDSGELSFVPKGLFQLRVPNLTNVRNNYSLGYGNEILYFNGQRLVRNENYLIVSENSLLNTGEIVRFNNDFTLYAGETGGLVKY